MKAIEFVKSSKGSRLVKIILAVIVLILVLIVPIKKTYPDGGTVFYSALTYRKIIWNVRLDYSYDTYRKGEEIHYFPNNFKSYDDYYKPYDEVTLELTNYPIQMYCVDGVRTAKINDMEYMKELTAIFNSAHYTYIGKAEEGAEEDTATILVYIRNISNDTVHIAICDEYTLNLEGYLYRADTELPYEAFLSALAQ